MLRQLKNWQLSRRPFVFDPERLQRLASQYQEAYQQNQPFKHIVIDNFLPEQVAEKVLFTFPDPSSPAWLDWRNRGEKYQPKKQAIGSAERLVHVSPYLQHVLFAFNSYAIINFLEQLTGIEGLMPDPHLSGGGLHQILSGGKLTVHSDFNFHKKLKIYRRVNLLLYLNKDWKEAYNGHLELWDENMSACAHRISPDFNRCVIFNTTADALHGHPEPLNTPPDVCRKSLALYYYTSEPAPGDEDVRRTTWQNRPGDTEG